MGPIALFDKSFLESLNVDEAVFFDYFFYPPSFRYVDLFRCGD